MFKWAALFLVLSVVSAILGFVTLAGVLAELVKFLFFLFMILFVAAVLNGLVNQPVEDMSRDNSHAAG